MGSQPTVLAWVLDYWARNVPSILERGVWIGWHQDLQEDSLDADSPILHVWFATDRRIEIRSPSSFKLYAENTIRNSSQPPFGVTHIARYASEHFHVSFIPAPLPGEALRIALCDGDVEVVKRLWVS